jgi:hypothetical protein
MREFFCPQLHLHWVHFTMVSALAGEERNGKNRRGPFGSYAEALPVTSLSR